LVEIFLQKSAKNFSEQNAENFAWKFHFVTKKS